MRVLIATLAVACSSPQVARVDGKIHGHLPDGRIATLTATDKISAVTDDAAATTTWLWPPIIDSHVHLAYWFVADKLAAAGVEGVVDLAAPERTLGAASPITVIAAGPMITHAHGYPLDAWGADGFGTGCGDAACVASTVDRLVARGAGVIKIAGDDDGLAPSLYAAVVAAAHSKGVVVAIHALSDASAAKAAEAGVDVLAHTPVEPLAPSTIAAWKGRAVISSLAAFGGSAAAVDNLRALRAAGVTVLYGTDLGNTRDAGPSSAEIALLQQAGLDNAAIVAAMTTAPIAFWKFPFGIAVGQDATLLVLDRDPRVDVSALLAPVAIYVRGKNISR